MPDEKELLLEVKKVHLEKCPDCLAKKQNRAAFRSRPPMRRKNTLDLMHTYVCKVDSKSPSYMTTTGCCGCPHCLQGIQPEGQLRRIPRVVRGIMGPLSRYPTGIYTVPKTPELNGMAKRMNRTVMERVRCMLACVKLLKTYWAEALKMTAYVIKRSP